MGKPPAKAASYVNGSARSWLGYASQGAAEVTAAFLCCRLSPASCTGRNKIGGSEMPLQGAVHSPHLLLVLAEVFAAEVQHTLLEALLNQVVVQLQAAAAGGHGAGGTAHRARV